MKYTNPVDIRNGYVEIDHLFCEWEWYGDGPSERVEIINVQMTHPDDRKDESKWLDITDYLTDLQKESLAEQVIEMYQDLHEVYA